MNKHDNQEGKRNYVHESIIREESIKNENKHLLKNRSKHYQLNPYYFNTITEKPTEVNPHRKMAEAQAHGLKKPKKETFFPESYTDDPIKEAFSNKKVLSTLQEVKKLPRQKYKAPQTANQEIGWYCQHYNQYKQTEDHQHKSVAITRWNADYVKVQGINPYTIK